MKLDAIASAIAESEAQALLALFGWHGKPLRAFLAARPDDFLRAVSESPRLLTTLWTELESRPYPGRSEAFLSVAHALGRSLPSCEYELPEARLDALMLRAESILGARVPVSGKSGHKGRVGDGVERLLFGDTVGGRATSDHGPNRERDRLLWHHYLF